MKQQFPYFFPVQGFQFADATHPLLELAHFRPAQSLQQLRLPGQNNLDQLFSCCFDIQQQPNLFSLLG